MFSEWYPGENEHLAAEREKRDVYRLTDDFSTYQEEVLSIADYMNNIVENEICSDDTKESFKNKDDRFFCQFTTCMNCRKCSPERMSEIRTFVKQLRKLNEYSLAEELYRSSGRHGFNNKIQTVMSEIQALNTKIPQG